MNLINKQNLLYIEKINKINTLNKIQTKKNHVQFIIKKKLNTIL